MGLKTWHWKWDGMDLLPALVALSFDVGPGPLSIGIEVGKANPSIKSAGSRSKASVKDVFLVLSP